MSDPRKILEHYAGRGPVGELYSADLAALQRSASCCDLHNRNCEPPSELCCEGCTEATHPGHVDGSRCIAPDLSGDGSDLRNRPQAMVGPRTNDDGTRTVTLVPAGAPNKAARFAGTEVFYALCWVEPPGQHVACDRMHGHRGRHSWEPLEVPGAPR